MLKNRKKKTKKLSYTWLRTPGALTWNSSPVYIKIGNGKRLKLQKYIKQFLGPTSV